MLFAGPETAHAPVLRLHAHLLQVEQQGSLLQTVDVACLQTVRLLALQGTEARSQRHLCHAVAVERQPWRHLQQDSQRMLAWALFAPRGAPVYSVEREIGLHI